jgi:hypothetical protein
MIRNLEENKINQARIERVVNWIKQKILRMNLDLTTPNDPIMKFQTRKKIEIIDMDSHEKIYNLNIKFPKKDR